MLAGWAMGIIYGTVAAYNVSSSNTDHFGGSTAAPFFLSSPMYIAISALILNLLVTLAWAWVSRQLRTMRARGGVPVIEGAGSTSETHSAATSSASKTQKESSVS